MHNQINAKSITELQKQSLLLWKKEGIIYQHQDFYKLVEENHAYNVQLWDAEDKARREDMGHEFVYHAKREIDQYNQSRNNRMESMDEWLFHVLQPETAESCPVNSESPGMIIDRLSILSLKFYHMGVQVERDDVSEEHKKTCARKQDIIAKQLNQLSLCLSQLFDEVLNKNRTFRVYHQFKMYNDPRLNPQLYDNAKSE